MTKKQMKRRIITAIKLSVSDHEDEGDKNLGDYETWTSWIMYITSCTYSELMDAMDAYRKETGKELCFA